MVVTLPGDHYAGSDILPGGTVAQIGGGKVRIETEGSVAVTATLTYELPAGSLPAGARIARLDAALCAVGGDFLWEAYGPAGAEPCEYEAVSPAADGCYHFSGGNGSNSTVKASVEGISSLTISKVVYTVRLVP